MTPELVLVAVVGSTIGLAALVGGLGLALGWVRRWWLVEATALLVVISALAMGVSGWATAAGHPGPLLLLLLAGLSAGSGRLSGGHLGLMALAGSTVFGSLPTLAVLLSRCRDAGQAARLALFCTAVGAASPLGGPIQILLGSDVNYVVWALPPAALCAILTWPGDAASTEPTAQRWRPANLARLAVAAWLIGVAAQLSEVARWIGVGAQLTVELGQPIGPIILFATGLAGGCLLEPWTTAAVLERAAWVGFSGTTTTSPVVLGMALSPVFPLALAASVHGREVFRQGIPLVALQLSTGALWVALMAVR